jgi:hypothetical protein
MEHLPCASPAAFPWKSTGRVAAMLRRPEDHSPGQSPRFPEHVDSVLIVHPVDNFHSVRRGHTIQATGVLLNVPCSHIGVFYALI